MLRGAAARLDYQGWLWNCLEYILGHQQVRAESGWTSSLFLTFRINPAESNPKMKRRYPPGGGGSISLMYQWSSTQRTQIVLSSAHSVWIIFNPKAPCVRQLLFWWILQLCLFRCFLSLTLLSILHFESLKFLITNFQGHLDRSQPLFYFVRQSSWLD